jgi:Fe-S oxidoreductase
MRIGLFIPCYIDAFFPEVGIATLELLERFGHDVDYPRDQTCCSQPARPDECCGFGGTFSVFEEVVSTKMGYDKVSDHAQAGAEYIVSADSSCLMNQQGCAERIGVPMKFIHIAQILNGTSA